MIVRYRRIIKGMKFFRRIWYLLSYLFKSVITLLDISSFSHQQNSEFVQRDAENIIIKFIVTEKNNVKFIDYDLKLIKIITLTYILTILYVLLTLLKAFVNNQVSHRIDKSYNLSDLFQMIFYSVS